MARKPKPKPKPRRRKATPPERTRSAPDWAGRFLARLGECGNILAACRDAAVSRSAVYERRDGDPAFARGMAEALEEATDALELEARRRGHDGADEPVIYQGVLMGRWVGEDGREIPADTPGARFVPLTVKRYSDRLLLALLQAHRPERFRVNHKHELSGPDGGPVKVEVYIPANGRGDADT